MYWAKASKDAASAPSQPAMLYALVFFLTSVLPAGFFAGAGLETGFFGAAAILAGAFFVGALFATTFFVGAFLATTFFVTTFFAGASFAGAFFDTALAEAAVLEPFQAKRAFFARATTLAMSSSEYTPLTPDMAASFMPCLMPSL